MASKKEVIRRKDLPHNDEAEKAVLGAMIRSRAKCSDAIGALKEDDFFPGNLNHRYIFSAMKRIFLRNEPVDIQTLTNELINSKQLEDCGGTDYLLELSDSVITFTNFDSYVRIIIDQAILRNYLLAINEISEQYYTGDIGDITSFLQNSEAKLTSISDKRKVGDFLNAQEICESLSEEIDSLKETKTDDTVTGTPTGFTRLNQITHGFQKGQFIVLAARTGVGKTALSLNLAYNAALKGYPVAYFSLETDEKLLFKRILSNETSVNYESLITGYNLNASTRLKLKQGCERLSKLKIYVDTTSGIQILELCSKIRSLINKEPDLGLVVVDYIGLVHTTLKSKDNRQLEVQLVSQTLKALALELKIPIIGVCQLNRKVEERGGDPQLSDLRESGSIEQDADVVLFISQNKSEQEPDNKNVLEKNNNKASELQNSVAKKETKNDDAVFVDLIVAKNRSGKTGKVPLIFCKNICKFSTPTKDAEQTYNNIEEEKIRYY